MVANDMKRTIDALQNRSNVHGNKTHWLKNVGYHSLNIVSGGSKRGTPGTPIPKDRHFIHFHAVLSETLGDDAPITSELR